MQLRTLLFIPAILLLLSACAVVDKLEENLEQMNQISDGPEMEKLQIALNKAGQKGAYSAGGVDGKFGPKTRAAIEAFQRQNGLEIDGKPTKSLLKKVENVVAGKTIAGRSDRGRKTQEPSFNCVDHLSPQERQLFDQAFEQLTGALPINIRPYLTGLCLPDGKDELEEFYLYMIASGATHSRLTLLKYEKLVALYAKAGVDLGVRRDAFKRSRESLRSDYRTLATDRRQGAERLLASFASAPAEQLLKALPEGYKQLEQKYRTEARQLMSSALAHSTSATFFLTRSIATGKALLEIAAASDTKGGLPLNLNWRSPNLDDLAERKRVASLVLGHRKMCKTCCMPQPCQ